MLTGLKIACGLYAALMLMLGARWWFTFDAMSLEWAVKAEGALGINNLMADMGSLFLGGAVLIGLGLWKKQSIWLLATAILMVIAAMGRLLAYATIGYAPETLVPLLFEIISAILLYGTHLQMQKATTAES
ncbi:MAG: hypothetical protein ACI9FB_000544 [Candidatus Azotimanducaceae bacterium]|jgi:hypothetical protein